MSPTTTLPTTSAPARSWEYDPFAPGFYDHAFETYRLMRDEAPVYRSEKWGWYALTRFEDVRAVLTDPDTYRSFEGMDIDDTEQDQAGPGSLPNMDNPRHDEIRRIVQPWFLPRRVGAHEDAVRSVVRRLVAGVVESGRTTGRADLARDLAWPLPFDVFFSLMGFPDAQDQGRAQLERWMHEQKGRVPGTPHLTPGATVATARINEFFVDILEQRRRDPQQDLVSHLVGADIDGVPFADEHITPSSEVLGLMMVLFLGGVESTAGLTATMFKLLAENPAQRDLLLADPGLVPDAVEEAMRMATPLQLTARTTSREVVLHGVTIPRGARVVAVTGAANRDERAFDRPDEFDVTRGRVRHVGFGEGIHGCLGAHLARLEATIAMQEALPVLGDYRLDGEPGFYPSSPNMYCWASLPVRFDADHTAAPAPRTSTTLTAPAADAPATDAPATELVTPVRLASRELAADGVAALVLEPAEGGALPAWEPGAHVDLVLGDDVATRQYSLCGDPGDTSSYRLGVLRDEHGRGSSLHVHDRLEVGDVVEVRGPRNNFALRPSARYLFLAGGIGITPLLPMVAAAQAAGADWRLVYGGRSRASMAFLDELAAYGDRVVLHPQDELGLLDLPGLLGDPVPETLVYCCGPAPLLDAVEEQCRDWPAGSLHVERFTPRALGAPVRDEAFEVELRRSGLTLEVPRDRSILEVVEEAGVATLSSCAEGTCGSCETRVLAGVPDHRDSVLDAGERERGDCLMICVSRSCEARLVLDL